MLDKIISGGNTGADQAAWRAAETFGVRTGGWMPKGFLTDDTPHLEFGERFAAEEMPTDSEPAAVERNVQDSGATLWFGETTTAGASATVGACQRLGKPCMLVYPGAAFQPSHVADWIVKNKIGVLNIAGNSERDEPGIGDRVEWFLGEVLERLGHVRS